MARNRTVLLVASSIAVMLTAAGCCKKYGNESYVETPEGNFVTYEAPENATHFYQENVDGKAIFVFPVEEENED